MPLPLQTRNAAPLNIKQAEGFVKELALHTALRTALRDPDQPKGWYHWTDWLHYLTLSYLVQYLDGDENFHWPVVTAPRTPDGSLPSADDGDFGPAGSDPFWHGFQMFDLRKMSLPAGNVQSGPNSSHSNAGQAEPKLRSPDQAKPTAQLPSPPVEGSSTFTKATRPTPPAKKTTITSQKASDEAMVKASKAGEADTLIKAGPPHVHVASAIFSPKYPPLPSQGSQGEDTTLCTTLFGGSTNSFSPPLSTSTKAPHAFTDFASNQAGDASNDAGHASHQPPSPTNSLPPLIKRVTLVDPQAPRKDDKGQFLSVKNVSAERGLPTEKALTEKTLSPKKAPTEKTPSLKNALTEKTLPAEEMPPEKSVSAEKNLPPTKNPLVSLDFDIPLTLNISPDPNSQTSGGCPFHVTSKKGTIPSDNVRWIRGPKTIRLVTPDKSASMELHVPKGVEVCGLNAPYKIPGKYIPRAETSTPPEARAKPTKAPMVDGRPAEACKTGAMPSRPSANGLTPPVAGEGPLADHSMSSKTSGGSPKALKTDQNPSEARKTTGMLTKVHNIRGWCAVKDPEIGGWRVFKDPPTPIFADVTAPKTTKSVDHKQTIRDSKVVANVLDDDSYDYLKDDSYDDIYSDSKDPLSMLDYFDPRGKFCKPWDDDNHCLLKRDARRMQRGINSLMVGIKLLTEQGKEVMDRLDNLQKGQAGA